MRGRPTPGWRKAPLALLHSPPVFAGVLVAALLLVLAGASWSLFTTAAGSAAFKEQIATMTPLGGGIQVFRLGRTAASTPGAVLRAHAAHGRAVERAVGRSDQLGALRASLVTAPVPVQSGGRSMEVLLTARDGARQHVRRLAGGGDGIWIADSVAAQVRVRPGARVVVGTPGIDAGTSPARVGAVYRALWKNVANDDWVNFSRKIYPPTRGDPDMPPTFALTSRAELLRLYLRVGGTYLEEVWEIPIRVEGLTLDRGRVLARRFAAVQRAVGDVRSPLARSLGCGQGPPFRQTRCSATSSLAPAIGLADEGAGAVAAPARLLGGIGLAISLAFAGAVGVFGVTRRRGEARHRFARGEGAAGFAERTAVEVAPALLVGATAGFALTLLLVHAFEPSASLDGAALRQAGTRSAAALGAGALLLVGAATATFLRQFDTAPRVVSRLWLVPWELVALGLGSYLLVAIRGGHGLSGHHPSLLVFAMPLLLLAGATGLALRIVRPLLARTRGRGLATYLAARRAAAGSGPLVALTVLCAVSLGVLFYAQALRASLDRGIREKAEIAVGGDVQASVAAGTPVPRLPFPASTVEVAYGGATVGGPTGPQVDLMEVDPATLGRAMHWEDAWGPRPARFLARLRQPSGGNLPVVVSEDLGRLRAIWIGGVRVPVEVVARVRAFPGMSTQAPLVVASAKALRAVSGGADPLTGPFAYVWARGPVPQVERALSASSLRPDFLVSVDEVRRNPDAAAARRAYSLLTALGTAVAALSLVGVTLYLYARQRGQALASALTRRMGLGRRDEVLSIWLELTAILAAAAALAAGVGLAAAAPVVGRTDPLPAYAPVPAFVVPWSVVGATFATLLAVALVAALATSAAARRADVVQELRLG